MPSGSVTFYVNSKSVGTVSLTSDTASYTTTFTSAGTDTIKAVYSGDTNFKTSTSANLSQVIQNTGGPDVVVSPGLSVDAALAALVDDSSFDDPVNGLALDQVSVGTLLPSGSRITRRPSTRPVS